LSVRQGSRDLAVRVADENAGPACGQNAIELARHDKTLEFGPQRDKVQVRGRQALRKLLSGLVRPKLYRFKPKTFHFGLEAVVEGAATDEEPSDRRVEDRDPLDLCNGAQDSFRVMGAAEIAGIANHETVLQAPL